MELSVYTRKTLDLFGSEKALIFSKEKYDEAVKNDWILSIDLWKKVYEEIKTL